MAMTDLYRNFQYVKKNWDTLVNLYPNKFILVHKRKVFESFDSYDKAAERGIELYGIDGIFLVHFMATIKANNFILHAAL